MTSPWLSSVTPIAPPSSANPRVRFLVYAGLVTGLWAGLLCLVVYAIGRAAGVPFEVVASGTQTSTEVPWPLVALAPVVAALAAALISAVVRGRRHAGTIVFWVFSLLALVSLSGPLMQPSDITWSTRILLALMHVITWLLVVPQLARIVRDSEPGRSLDRHPHER